MAQAGTELDLAGQRRLVAALATRMAAAHGPVRHIETHISHVLVAGDEAWKLHKALATDFLDFRRLAARRRDSQEELRLNRRLAPAMYLGLMAVSGTPDAPRLEEGVGGPDTLDVLLRLRAFDGQQQWDALLAANRLHPATVRSLAPTLWRFQGRCAVATAGGPWGQAAQVRAPVLATLASLRRLCPASADLRTLRELTDWEAATAERLAPWWGERLAGGFVREGHGDLHLGNIAQVDGQATPFDALSFDPALRWIDVASDVAFLEMDLRAHGRPDLSQHWLDAWLQCSGDAGALPGQRYQRVYRALVRAKIAALRADQTRCDADRTAVDALLRLATLLSRPQPRRLVITHGLSGSGKTTASTAWLAAGDGVRWRSDVERKRLAGLAADARSGSSLGTGLYGPDASAATQARLLDLADRSLRAGFAVLLDATHLRRADRDAAQALARRHGLDCEILHLEAAPDVLRERLRQRAAEGRDASEADARVLEAQLASQEPLGHDELVRVLLPT